MSAAGREAPPAIFIAEGSRVNRNKEACHCRNVTYGMIEDAVKAGAKTPREVERVTHYGGGCGKCREFIEYLIRDLLENTEKK